MPRKVYLETFGCQMNVLDSELVMSQLRAHGYESVEIAAEADVILAVGPDRKAADEWLHGWRAYPTLKAVRNGRLIPWTDQRLSRLGPSMVDATEALCAALRR